LRAFLTSCLSSIPIDILCGASPQAFTSTYPDLDERPSNLWTIPIQNIFELLKEPIDLHRALGELHSFSVIEKLSCKGDTEPFIRFHPLCGILSSSGIHRLELPSWIEAATTIMFGALQKVLEEASGKISSRSYRLRPHVFALLKHMKADPECFYQPFFSRMLYKLGCHLRDIGDYPEAVDMLHLADTANRNGYHGHDHPHTLRIQEQRADLCGQMGDYTNAATMHNEVLQKRKKLLGRLHRTPFAPTAI